MELKLNILIASINLVLSNQVAIMLYLNPKLVKDKDAALTESIRISNETIKILMKETSKWS